MAASPNDLPEGTDSIIDDDASAPAGAGGDYDGKGEGASRGNQTDFGATSGPTQDSFKQKFVEATSGLSQQAGEKARAYAAQGKDQATAALDNLARMVTDAAGNVDEQLGPQYGAYARQAADYVSGISSSLQAKDIDTLVAEAGELVRKSPVVAIGTAAALGFALVRLVKSGFEATAPVASPGSEPVDPAV